MTLLNSLICSRNFYVSSLVFLARQSSHLQVGRVFSLPFWSVCSVWNKMVRVNILALFPVFQRKHSVFPCYVVFCRYSIQLTKVPSIPIYLKIFITNRCSIMSHAFSSSIDIIMWFFFVSWLIWWIALIYFHTSKLPCISWKNLMCSWYVIVLSVLLNCIWCYVVTDFYTYMHEYYSFHFFVSFLSTIFGYQSNVNFNKMNLDFSCLFYFLEEIV